MRQKPLIHSTLWITRWILQFHYKILTRSHSATPTRGEDAPASIRARTLPIVPIVPLARILELRPRIVGGGFTSAPSKHPPPYLLPGFSLHLIHHVLFVLRRKLAPFRRLDKR